MRVQGHNCSAGQLPGVPDALYSFQDEKALVLSEEVGPLFGEEGIRVVHIAQSLLEYTFFYYVADFVRALGGNVTHLRCFGSS